MKTRSIFISLSILLLSLASCQKDNYISDYVASVAVENETNAMRVIVKPEFKKDCTYSVRYWKSGVKNPKSFETVNKSSSDKDGALLLFLSPLTEYSYRFIIDGQEEPKTYTFKTIDKPGNLYNFQIKEINIQDWVDGYILQTNASEGYVTLCDYDGKIVWYDKYAVNSNFAWYDPATGMMAFFSNKEKLILSVDLAGNVLFRGNSSKDFIPDLHHDLRMLDNMNMIALSRVPKNYGGIDYYGEAITEFDPTGKVVFYWDTFENFNPIVTPEIPYEPSKQDYLHANSIEKDSNGDYYMTLNWLTEIIKIDGKTGKLVYRFGANGDVAITGETPEVYHSKQSPSEFLTEGSGVHTAIALEPDRILCLANGKDDSISKAAVVKIDPVKKQAHYEMLVDFEKRFNTPDRSNVSILPGERLLLGSAPLDIVVIANYKGETIRVLSRQFISPRSLYYAPEQFNHYLKVK